MAAAKTVRRASLPLTASDEQDMRMLKESPEYLDQLGIDRDSEAAMLHAIHELGIRAIKDRIAEIGYELLARQRADQDPSETAARKARRSRQAANWGDE